MFILRNLFALRQRRRSALHIFLFIGGIFACLTAGLMGAIAIPMNLVHGSQLTKLARPTPAELHTLSAGTKVLILGQIPTEAETSEAMHGLALFYVERAESVGNSKVKLAREPQSKTVREREVEPKVTLALSDGTFIRVRVPAQTTLGNAQRIKTNDNFSEVAGLRIERTYIGYLPGQTLAVEGVWEGGSLTASEFFAGSIDDYVRDVQVTQPLQMAGMALCCGGFGVVLAIAGLASRFLRR